MTRTCCPSFREGSPTVAGGPGVMIVNSAAAAKTMIVDYFEMAITGLSR